MVISLNLLSLKATLSFGKMKKSHGVKSREQRGCVTIHFVCRHKFKHTDKVQCAAAFSWWRNQSPPNSNFQLVSIADFPTDGIRYQQNNASLQFVLAEQI
jgi:hypothetical protein